jgi:hypothetical protein
VIMVRRARNHAKATSMQWQHTTYVAKIWPPADLSTKPRIGPSTRRLRRGRQSQLPNSMLAMAPTTASQCGGRAGGQWRHLARHLALASVSSPSTPAFAMPFACCEGGFPLRAHLPRCLGH